MIRFVWTLVAFACMGLGLAGPAGAQQTEPTPLFANTDDDVIRLSIRGPIGDIADSAARSTAPRPATLTLDGASPESHAIQLSARGITRRRRDICRFPPLRIEFTQPPAETSLFARQRRIKLVTHCRDGESFQQFLLLEYAAYRTFNALTPLSFRVQLAEIAYYEGDADRPTTTRLGFLIEDIDDTARRNGLREIEGGNFSPARLDPESAARFGVFQYMIGNLDWAMEAGPPDDDCCHNSKPIAERDNPSARYIPVPYDFDHAGMVDAPYATPPAQLNMSNVRERRYRGFCAHNAEATAAAAELLAQRARLEAVFASVPRLEERTRSRAISYMSRFFENVATPADVQENLMRSCLG